MTTYRNHSDPDGDDEARDAPMPPYEPLPPLTLAAQDAAAHGSGAIMVGIDFGRGPDETIIVRHIPIEEMREQYPSAQAQREAEKAFLMGDNALHMQMSGRVKRSSTATEIQMKIASGLDAIAAYESRMAERFYEGAQWPAPERGPHAFIFDSIARHAAKAMYEASVCPPYRVTGFTLVVSSIWIRAYQEEMWTLERVRRTTGR